MGQEIKIVPNKKIDCCGCSICEKICPKKAIKMDYDKEGFLYPKVDKNKCVECGICIDNCAFYNATENKNDINKVYIAKHKNNQIRMNSRSGAVFVSCSDWILKNNGVVYGCILDEKMRVIHIRAENQDERNEMCKSKYVQSNISNILSQIEEDLKEEKYVLFTGTGCQVDAVLNYLKVKKINTKKLYTIDIICHGVVSPLIFKEYIKWLEKRYKGKVEKFEFRDKTIKGWKGYKETAIINNKKHKLSYYRQIFNTDLCIRPSCYNCKYTKVKRNSNITIGDAWGINEALPNFNDNLGVSIVIVQNKKGQDLLNIIEKDCEIKEMNIEPFLQPNLKRPTKLKGNREEFWRCFENGGIKLIIRKYGKVKYSKKILRIIKNKIK